MAGGVVRVVVVADDDGVKKLSFVYPDGPAQPRLERDLIVAGRKRAEGAEARKGRARKRAEGEPSEPSEESPSEPQAS